jgi:SPP1 family predicted phage head-tail adaptor
MGFGGFEVRSGELKNRIDLQAQIRTPDGGGGFNTSWVTVVSSLAAAIWPMKGAETMEGGRTVAAMTHQIRIRYRDGVKPSMRIKFGSKYFNIVSIINPNTDFKALDLMAKEVV